jgi:predicted TIM-barrel fold metal-dependent hydrolase
VTVIETQSPPESGADVAVTIVDCDIHPMPHHSLDLLDFAPEPQRSQLKRRGNELPPAFASLYDLVDWEHARGQRTDAVPPDGGFPGSDPEFAFQQVMVEAGVDIGILLPFWSDQLLNPEAEQAFKMAQNNWLSEVWLDKGNKHERWRGSIYVTAREPEAGAREIERWAGHPYMVQVLMAPSTRGVQFGDPRLDPIYEAASRHGLPVATHASGPQLYDLIPILPVGNPTRIVEFGTYVVPMFYMTHLMSLVFDGTFERFPDLKFVFVEGAFLWAMPLLWRMDAIWEHRRADMPWVKRKPSEYVRDHVWFTTQPLEDVETPKLRKYLEWMDAADYLVFSTDYPHWTYDDPSWVRKRLPEAALERIMSKNAIELFGLPATVSAIS